LNEPYQSYPENYWAKKILAPSGFRIFLGLDKQLDALTHHNLYLNPDWDTYFNQVYGPSPMWPDDPSYYICCQTKTDADMAPPGGEAFSILVLVAPDLVDTPKRRRQYSEKILTHFENIIGEPFKKNIIVQKIVSVNDYIGLYNAYKGTALGMAHTLRQTAVFRPSHQSKEVENLYCAGHYTHPGIGVPVTLISAQLATRKITGEQS
jgi:phytoene desaturase